MSSKIQRYNIKYDEDKFAYSEENAIPADLKAAVLGIFPAAEFYFHSASRLFFAVGIHEEYVNQVRTLDGIIFVAKDVPQIRLEKRWKRPFSQKEHPY